MTRSAELFDRANSHIPGGVNSPVRAFSGVGGSPIFFKRGQGAYVTDVDDKTYIDYVGSWGPLILGHNHPRVKQAVIEAVEDGLTFGAPTELEVIMAETIYNIMPALEKVRMVNSGTEATMTAIRMARGITGRKKILKFKGCYHGHSDSLLVSAGSGVLTLGLPSCPGVTDAVAADTLTAPFNDLATTTKIIEQYKEELAAVIIEPVAGNMNCIMPSAGFLQGLRERCNKTGALLIFDEVMTGFRVTLGGAQALFDITPDITTFGKIIGGGMPVGAIGGGRKVMDCLAPIGKVYQAGTLSGNPIAMAAGLATLNELIQPGFYQALSQTTDYFVQQLKACAQSHNIPLAVTAVGGMFGFCFTEKDTVSCFEDVENSNISRFKRFFHGMKAQGIYLAPSAFEAGFVSAAHGEEEIDLTLKAANNVFRDLAS